MTLQKIGCNRLLLWLRSVIDAAMTLRDVDDAAQLGNKKTMRLFVIAGRYFLRFNHTSFA